MNIDTDKVKVREILNENVAIEKEIIKVMKSTGYSPGSSSLFGSRWGPYSVSVNGGYNPYLIGSLPNAVVPRQIYINIGYKYRFILQQNLKDRLEKLEKYYQIPINISISDQDEVYCY